MKKLFMMALSAAMALSIAGCKKPEVKPVETALTLMDQVNAKNIVSLDNTMRLWYQINPALFTDKVTGEPGTVRSILTDIEYLSDGDPETSEDLNMSGILLTDIMLLDDVNAPKDLQSLNPLVGSEEDLQSLFSRAAGLNMPVMLTMEFSCISKENPEFRRMIDTVTQNADAENLFEMDPVLFGEFYVEKDKPEEDGWTKIGNTAYSYRSLPQTDIPRINLENERIRQIIQESVSHYLDLGAGGFYVPDYNDLFVGEDQKAADFMNWFNSIVKEKNEQAVTVFSYSSWNEPMNSVPVFAADQAGVGAEGMIAKAATGAISARDLGAYLEGVNVQSGGMNASFINNTNSSLDLLKVNNRLPQYKMALALQIMTSGQIFLMSGDELGLTSEQTDLILDAIEAPEMQDDEDSSEASSGTQINLEFGSLADQKKDGNSILNFVQQAIKLRDSYSAIASGSMTWSQELSTDQMLVIDKRSTNSECVLVFNLSDKEAQLDTTPIKISGLPAELGGVLLSSTDEIKLENNSLTLPPYSMALLK